MKTLSDYISELKQVREAEDENKEQDTEETVEEPSEDIEKDDTEETSEESDEESEDAEKDEDAVDMNGFMVLKPEFLSKESDLRSRLEEEGWEVVGEQEKKLSEKEAKAFYDAKKNEPYFDDLIKYMTSGKSKCFMIWKEDSEDPIGEIKTLKEKLRQEWSDDEMKNVLHSSDSFDDMEKELSIFLAEPEEEEKPEKEEEETKEDTKGEDTEMGDNSEESDDNADNEPEADEEEDIEI